jgi:uncharacterized protein YcbK (DUF882 family)
VTGESFNGTYYGGGRYDRDSLRELNWLFRDVVAAEAMPMDPRLFDLLYSLQGMLSGRGPILLLDGYRTQERNDDLARRNGEIDRASTHISGMAADVILPGVGNGALASAAKQIRQGGWRINRAPASVHVDCGHTRQSAKC